MGYIDFTKDTSILKPHCVITAHKGLSQILAGADFLIKGSEKSSEEGPETQYECFLLPTDHQLPVIQRPLSN